MYNLLRLISLRRVYKDKVRTLLTLFGVVLGVASFLSVSTVNHSINGAFVNMVGDIAGEAQLQITCGDAGFPEPVLEEVKKVPGIKAAAPTIQTFALVKETGESLLILGVDFLSDQTMRAYRFLKLREEIEDPILLLSKPQSLIVTEEFAKRHNLTIDSTIRLGTAKGSLDFSIQGFLAAEGPAKAFGGNVALMFINAAQVVFDKENKFDRIDLMLEDAVEVAPVQAALQKILGATYQVELPTQRSSKAQSMIVGFQTGLTLISLVSLLVGIFIIYNSISIAVVQRRREIGILRGTGVTRGSIIFMFLLESTLVGLIGSALGVVFGIFLAEVLLGRTTDAVGSIFGNVSVRSLDVPPGAVFWSFFLGIGASLISALTPAIQASFVSPLEPLRQGALQVRKRPLWPLAIVGILFLGLSMKFASLQLSGPLQYYGYLSAFLWIVGFAFFVPSILPWFKKLAGPVVTAAFGVQGGLGAENLVKAAGRNAICISAFMIALTITYASSWYVTSFNRAIVDWIENTIRADIYVSSASSADIYKTIPVSEDLAKDIETIPGVKEVDLFRITSIDYGGRPIFLMTVNRSIFDKHNTPVFVAGGRADQDNPGSDRAAFISNNFAKITGLTAGGNITLNTPKGPLTLPIRAVFVDFTSDRGTILIDRWIYQQYWSDPTVNMFDVFLKDGANIETVKTSIQKQLGTKYPLFVVKNQEYRDSILGVVNNVFTLSFSLQYVTIIIALFGITNALLASVIDRTRETGILRAIGTTRGQLKGIITLEAALMGFLGNFLGLVCGYGLAIILNDVINAQATGWVLKMVAPYGDLAVITAVSIGVAILAGYYPAVRAGMTPITEALEYE